MSKIAKVNFIWSICFMLFITLGMVIVWCCRIDIEGQPIVHYLSIAATILSITLSIFSIAFSYYSLTSSASQWGKINSAISAMHKANENIMYNNRMLFDNVVRITQNIGELRGQGGLADNLNGNFANTTMGQNLHVQNLVRDLPGVGNLANMNNPAPEIQGVPGVPAQPQVQNAAQVPAEHEEPIELQE